MRKPGEAVCAYVDRGRACGSAAEYLVSVTDLYGTPCCRRHIGPLVVSKLQRFSGEVDHVVVRPWRHEAEAGKAHTVITSGEG